MSDAGEASEWLYMGVSILCMIYLHGGGWVGGSCEGGTSVETFPLLLFSYLGALHEISLAADGPENRSVDYGWLWLKWGN